MIQTKTPILYGDRSEKTAVIKVEVRPTQDKNTFNVIDFEIVDGLPNAIFTKPIFKSDTEIDTLSEYIEVNYSSELSGLTETQKDYKKIQIALMLDTQTNLLPSGKTIYRRNPEDWEFTPES